MVAACALGVCKATDANSSTTYVYPHMMKTGGTTLSVVLALTTRVVCGSRLSSEFQHKDECPPGKPWFGTRQDQFVELSRGLAATPWETTLPRCAFGHFLPATPKRLVHGAIAAFPDAKLLLLLRDPVAHRASYFAQNKGTARPAANFSSWIRSRAYRRAEYGMQVAAYAWLGSPDADALLANDKVAWVGVADAWMDSLCQLATVLGVRLADGVWALKSRLRPHGSPLQDVVSVDDFAFLAHLEAEEARFVRLVLRHVQAQSCTPSLS